SDVDTRSSSSSISKDEPIGNSASCDPSRGGSGLRILGIDLGGTNIKRVVLKDGRVVEASQIRTFSEAGPDAVINRISALASAAGPVDAIGSAVPGAIDGRGRPVVVANLDGDWSGRPLAEPFQRLFSGPVPVMDDGHACR